MRDQFAYEICPHVVSVPTIGRLISDCGKYMLLPNLPSSTGLKTVYKSYLKEGEPAGFSEETTFEYNIVRYSREGRHGEEKSFNIHFQQNYDLISGKYAILICIYDCYVSILLDKGEEHG